MCVRSGERVNINGLVKASNILVALYFIMYWLKSTKWTISSTINLLEALFSPAITRSLERGDIDTDIDQHY